MVRDDGVGMAEDFDLERDANLGLQLVSTLVDQLDGSLGTPGPGAGYLITFERSIRAPTMAQTNVLVVEDESIVSRTSSTVSKARLPCGGRRFLGNKPLRLPWSPNRTSSSWTSCSGRDERDRSGH